MSRTFITKRRVLALILFALVLLGPYLASRLASSGRRLSLHALDTSVTARTFDGSLRIACFNIAHGRGEVESNWDGGDDEVKKNRLEQIGKLLQQVDADVVVLNEVDFDSSWSHSVNQAEYLAQQAGYRYRIEQRNIDARVLFWTWRFGNAVLSRYPISNPKVVDFPDYARWETILAGKKRGVTCEIDLGQRQVRLIAVHLSPRSEALRADSAFLLTELARASRLPTVVAGDLNSAPPGHPGSRQDDAGRNALAELTIDGPLQFADVDPEDAAQFTFSTKQPRCAIDWILIPADWQFKGYWVVPTFLSDHRFVHAAVEDVGVKK